MYEFLIHGADDYYRISEEAVVSLRIKQEKYVINKQRNATLIKPKRQRKVKEKNFKKTILF